MTNLNEISMESAIDIYSTAHLMILHQGDDAIEMLNTEVQELRESGDQAELSTCLYLLRVVEELIDMEIKGPIH